MSNEIENNRLLAALGSHGKRAQLKEFERQLRYLPKWLESKKKEAVKRKKELKVKIARLKRVV